MLVMVGALANLRRHSATTASSAPIASAVQPDDWFPVRSGSDVLR